MAEGHLADFLTLVELLVDPAFRELVQLLVDLAFLGLVEFLVGLACYHAFV